MVSRVNASQYIDNLTKYFVVFIFVSIISIALPVSFSYAQQAPEEAEVSIPATCSAPAPAESAPGIHFTPTTSTNNPGLQWNWTFTPPEGEEAFAADSYSYALYNGASLQSQGSLDIATTSHGYAAPSDGNYILYLWTVQAGQDPAYCSIASIPLDFTPPVIVNNGYDLDDPMATPKLSTNETGLTYSWTVNGLGDGVEINDATALNPTFTFLLDDTYNFVLTATDSFGNSTNILLSIVYTAPFVTPPTGPIIISEEDIPEPIQEYTPLEESEPIAYAEPVPSVDGKLPPVVDASIYASTAEGREALNTSEKDVAGAVTAGQDGWRIAGVSWYWWLLGIALIAAVWLWLQRSYQSRVAAADDI